MLRVYVKRKRVVFYVVPGELLYYSLRNHSRITLRMDNSNNSNCTIRLT